MKIVKLNAEYLKLIRKENPNYPEKGIGVHLYHENFYYFIPLTSKNKTIDYLKNKKPIKYNYFKVGMKNGSLLIQNYIRCSPHLITIVQSNSTVISQIQFLQKNLLKIKKKLSLHIDNSKKNHIKNNETKIFEKFLNTIINKTENRESAKKYLHKAVESMAVIEKITFPKEITEKVIQCKTLEKFDDYDIQTILNLKLAWQNLYRNLYKPLNLDYVIKINKIIASHQALEVGILRNKINYVSGEFLIPIPIESKIVNLLNKNFKEIESIENNALQLFIHIIIKQWFFDGNKRTAFVILNKILIEAGLGICLIDQSNQSEFDSLLYSCYRNNYKGSRKNKIDAASIFVRFLKEKCITHF